MKNNSIQQLIRNAVLLSAIVLLSIISTVVIEETRMVGSTGNTNGTSAHVITSSNTIDDRE